MLEAAIPQRRSFGLQGRFETERRSVGSHGRFEAERPRRNRWFGQAGFAAARGDSAVPEGPYASRSLGLPQYLRCCYCCW